MSLEGSFEPRNWVYFSNVLRKTVPYDWRTYRERTRGQGGPCARNCQQTRVAQTQGTFRFVTVYEVGQISGLLGCSDLVCQRGDLEGGTSTCFKPWQSPWTKGFPAHVPINSPCPENTTGQKNKPNEDVPPGQWLLLSQDCDLATASTHDITAWLRGRTWRMSDDWATIRLDDGSTMTHPTETLNKHIEEICIVTTMVKYS